MAGNLNWCFWCFFAAAALNLDLIEAEADLSNFQETRNGPDARPRLSASQQAQILSDVQQHQQRFTSPSLAKYKVDRNKQQQIQQLLQQQQQIQRLIQEQQRKIAQQLENPRYFDRFEAASFDSNPQFQQQQQQQVDNVSSDVRNLYLEKQRELQALQRQRQQLLQQQIAEQQEKKQQEAFKQQKTNEATLVDGFRTTTFSPVLVSLPAARKITPSESELFLKAIATHQKKFLASTTPVLPTEAKIVERTSTERILLPATTQITVVKPKSTPKTVPQLQNLDRDHLLRQLKQALSESTDSNARNVSTRNIITPNADKIRLTNSESSFPSSAAPTSSTIIATPSEATTIKAPKAIFDELTRGVLPPGADFEVIRQKSDGKLEEIGKTPPQTSPGKKVTFVVLEEQPDGSYKVQGVKGNAEKDGGDLDSIVERIKKGELKLPPSSGNAGNYSGASGSSGGRSLEAMKIGAGRNLTRANSGTSKSSNFASQSTSPSISTPTTTDKYESSASSVSSHVFNQFSPTTTKFTVSEKFPAPTRNYFIPTMAPVNEIVVTTPTIAQTSAAQRSNEALLKFAVDSSTKGASNEIVREKTTQPPSARNELNENLNALLRSEGFFAMAKYLRQSGLDIVLNETGPYTIFVPTDKAFRTLLVQLGGPEKAEQKFKENPRLLSGLLLHHVIPGAFAITSLQDEMTGVSLAGTQLRVNDYPMHDHEWNDIKVTTINGAKVSPSKRDIEIPQGVAHAIDRVMFPLPVGDLVQTLQADRERRFTAFLKILTASGLQETLTGPKTFTVFAPMDAAFETAAKDGTTIWTEDDGPEAAKTIISRHVIPSTLYTAGMRYYLQKDSLRPQSPVHIHKNGGRVRINEAHVVTHNVPATNGVLHAIDAVL